PSLPPSLPPPLPPSSTGPCGQSLEIRASPGIGLDREEHQASHMRLLPYGTLPSSPSSPFSPEAPLTAVSAMPLPPPSLLLLAMKPRRRHSPSCLVRQLGPLLPVVLLPPLSLHRCLPLRSSTVLQGT
ncbi:hypothetical protein Naga_103517g1, partial [Nannochloropsis gaditana]